MLDFVAEEETDDPESGDNAEEWVLPDTTNRGGGVGAAAGNRGGSSCTAIGGAADAGGAQAATHVHNSI